MAASGTPFPDNWQFEDSDVKRVLKRTHTRTKVNMVFEDDQQGDMYDYIYYTLHKTDSSLDQIMLVSTQIGSEGLMKF